MVQMFIFDIACNSEKYFDETIKLPKKLV